jgi:beta-glucanase (GH16 family)
MLHYFKRASVENVVRAATFCIAIGVVMVSVMDLQTAPAQTSAKNAGKSGGGTTAQAAGGRKQDSGTQDPGTNIPGWVLKFSDEFDGRALDYSKWSPHPPGKLVLGGIQTWIPEAIELSGGEAHLIARRTGTGFTSGVMTTLGTFAQTFGRFEIRFRMPAGNGLEPLFRLLPVPNGETPSIDVMNAIGSDPATALFANRWQEAQIDRDYSGSYKVGDLSAGLHIVAVEWDEEKIVWTVDGMERFQSFDGVPHQPLYLAVCLLAGSERTGEPDAQTRFPAAFDIDYIRVFARP